MSASRCGVVRSPAARWPHRSTPEPPTAPPPMNTSASVPLTTPDRAGTNVAWGDRTARTARSGTGLWPSSAPRAGIHPGRGEFAHTGGAKAGNPEGPARQRRSRDRHEPDDIRAAVRTPGFGQMPTQRCGHCPVVAALSRTRIGTAWHRDLVTRHQDLRVLRCRRPSPQRLPGQLLSQDQVHWSSGHSPPIIGCHKSAGQGCGPNSRPGQVALSAAFW